MATDESKVAVQELEHLTGLAFTLLRSVGQPEIGEHERHLFYVAGVFKALSLNADSVLRLHPLSVFYTDAGKPVWNPAALAALTRMLMEACADLHYFTGIDVDEGEREFRCIIAHIQRVRGLIKAAGALPEADSEETNDPAWLGRRKLELRPDELAFWLTKLEGSGHFGGLPPDQQEAWRTGNFPRRGTPRHQRDGYILDRRQRAENAGIPEWVHTKVYRLLSEYTHTSASGIDRIFLFQPFDRVAIRSQITAPICLSCGFVAHAITTFVEVFPACKSRLSPELHLLIDRWRHDIMRPSTQDTHQ